MRGPGHPTTSEQEYTADEMEFMFAMHAFKQNSGHQFPTCCETLRVLVKLGYHKGDVQVIADPPVQVVYVPRAYKRREVSIHPKTLAKMRRIAMSEGFDPEHPRRSRS